MTSFNLEPKPQAKASEKKKSLLDEDQFLMLCYIEQKFWETGYIPTNEVIQRELRLDSKTIDRAWKKDTFREAIISRGIDLKGKESGKVLTPTQLMLANLLLNAHDTRSVREKIASINVSSQQYHAWKRQPAFAEYLRKRAEAVFSAADSTAYTKLVEAVEEGDTNALKLFFEMRGIHNPRVQVDVNIQGVMVRVVEIISKHVQDPLVLDAIANEMAMLGQEALNG